MKSRGTISSGFQLLSAAAIVIAAASCAEEADPGAGAEVGSEAALARACPPPEDSVGLALEVDNGVGVPVQLRAGQRFHLNQIDLRASVVASVDEGVAGLDAAGDFADLDWDGVELRDEEFIPAPNADGTFTRRRFYREADWMEDKGELELVQIDADGDEVGDDVEVETGKDDKRKNSDGFFIRRYRAIQWTYDCATASDCSTADNLMEEALVELRHATEESESFELHEDTVAFELRWSENDDATYVIPVTQIEVPTYDYGIQAEIAAITPPSGDGYYLPGQDVTFQVTLRDGSGNRLHPEGSFPTYADVSFGFDDSGILYWRGPFEASATYWRRKHREAMLAVHFVGPAQDVQPIRNFVGIEQFFGPYVEAGNPTEDGVLSQVSMIPSTGSVFAGMWSDPVSDTVTFHLTDDAQPGTYLATVKGRRKYLGEDVPFSTTVEVQVGTADHTEAQLETGPCDSCHSGPGSLSIVAHANENRATCAGCHAPLPFEYEGPVFVRVHYIHSRSDRVDHSLDDCSVCHLTPESIERTSKAACLSCHTSYPEDHVEDFGPITSSYVGGAFDSFEPCGGECHTTHPGDGL